MITIMIMIMMIIIIIIIISSSSIWLRTNGVSTNGAAAKVTNFDRLGEMLRPGTFGKTLIG